MRSGTGSTAIGALVLAPLVYFLSIGPAVTMCPATSAHLRLGPIDATCRSIEPMLITMYTPLLALRETPLGPALERWIELWR